MQCKKKIFFHTAFCFLHVFQNTAFSQYLVVKNRVVLNICDKTLHSVTVDNGEALVRKFENLQELHFHHDNYENRMRNYL